MKVFQYCVYDGGFWFRIFGVGLSVVDRRKHRQLFSERVKARKSIKVLNYSVVLLTNDQRVKQ